jgi:putative acetyltransferase
MLRQIIDEARRRSLDYFAPARALYRRHGFIGCPPFSDYLPNPGNVFFMTLELPR